MLDAMEIYLCDDEKIWLNRLGQMISRYPGLGSRNFSIALSTASPSQLLEYLQLHAPLGGVYFLDIMYQEKMNGVKLGQLIRTADPQATLIYVTQHGEMMSETFRLKLQALDYILKNDADLCNRIHQCLNHLEQSCPQRFDASSRITLSLGRSRRIVSKEEIYYIQTVKGTHQILVSVKEGSFTATGTLNAVRQQLPDSFFICRRDILINICHVVSADHLRKELLLDNGHICPCSARMWNHILETLDAAPKILHE